MSATQRLATMVLLASAASCSPAPEDQRTDTMDVPQAVRQERESLPVEVTAQLDSGSAAFRADDFQAALAHYTKATEIAPDVAAGWFGVYMAQEALGDSGAAQDALAKAQAAEPGATLIHPTRSDTVR